MYITDLILNIYIHGHKYLNLVLYKSAVFAICEVQQKSLPELLC